MTQEKLIHKMMLNSARLYPDNAAVKYHIRTQTFRNLAVSSAAISACLNELDVRSHECVGLYLDKSIEAIQSIYGVLRSAAIYVPLDVLNPEIRLRHIIDQSDIRYFITQPDHVEKLMTMLSLWGRDAKIVILDEKKGLVDSARFEIRIIDPFSEPSQALENHHDRATDPEDVAVILYTSGSTGLPKGVMITHYAVAIFCDWVVKYFDFQPWDNCVSHAPLHFDLSLLDVFATHMAAAEVVLVPQSMASNPKYLNRMIAEDKITLWQSVPSALVLMLKYGDIENYDFSRLRHVLFAGEVMRSDNLRQLADSFSHASFHNIYGCTETNDTFIYSLEADCDVFPDPLPIGKPLPYVDYKVQGVGGDADQNSIEGELYVRTPTALVGYKDQQMLQKQEISAKSQEEDDLSGFYKTNDIVRVLDDGNLVFCGRADDIIKTNGYRVNILEIENALRGHEGIGEVAVVPLCDAEIGHRIHALIKLNKTCSLSSIDLKVFCAERLPKYAIPHSFEITYDPLPKTSSGKTNKQSIIQSRSRHVQ